MNSKNRSPIYLAVEKILKLFDLEDKVLLFSYRDDFDVLWEIAGAEPAGHGKIWCVVDDHEAAPRWLPIGIWGRYFRAKNIAEGSPVIIAGRENAVHPSAVSDKINVPTFYKDEGLCTISFESGDLVSVLLSFLDKDKHENPSPEMVKAWQGLVFSSLSSPGSRHAVSNEIAPMVLYESLLHLQPETSQKKKISLGDLRKTLQPGLTAAALARLKNAFKPNAEQKAILKLWEWASNFVARGVDNDDGFDLAAYLVPDVWGMHAKARFLLVDDQARSHGYDHLLRAVLEITEGKEVSLECRTELSENEAELLEIIKNYDTLFLDLRLKESDQHNTDYRELLGVKIALKLTQLDPSFPIVIFSSSQQREIERVFSASGNVILDFRKPGIAGSITTLQGQQGLKNLFTAVRKALELVENRIVFKKIMELPPEAALIYRNSYGRDAKETMMIDRSLFINVYKAVFYAQRYDLAFTFPFSFFEDIFSDRYGTQKNNRKMNSDLKHIARLGVRKTNTANRQLKIENGNLDAIGNLKITLNDEREIAKLQDFEIMQSTTELSLAVRALNQMRNLASHGLRDFSHCRREAIVTLLLFFDLLKNGELETGERSEYLKLGNVDCDKINNVNVYVCFPLMRFYDAQHGDVKKFIYELFASVCYFGSKWPTDGLMYELLRSESGYKVTA